jgi:hypothetical protein
MNVANILLSIAVLVLALLQFQGPGGAPYGTGRTAAVVVVVVFAVVALLSYATGWNPLH